MKAVRSAIWWLVGGVAAGLVIAFLPNNRWQLIEMLTVAAVTAFGGVVVGLLFELSSTADRIEIRLKRVEEHARETRRMVAHLRASPNEANADRASEGDS